MFVLSEALPLEDKNVGTVQASYSARPGEKRIRVFKSEVLALRNERQAQLYQCTSAVSGLRNINSRVQGLSFIHCHWVARRLSSGHAEEGGTRKKKDVSTLFVTAFIPCFPLQFFHQLQLPWACAPVGLFCFPSPSTLLHSPL